MYFKEKYQRAQPKSGEIALVWLGQAGFIIRNGKKSVLAIDVYLSDLSYRLDGNKRLMMSIIKPEDIGADVILASHSHADHLDLDSLPVMMANGSKLICCTKSYEMCKNIGLDITQVEAVSVGDVRIEKGFRIESVYCDHGDYAPEAVGFLIETDGCRIYFVGDSIYRAEKMMYVSNQEIDILLVPINGEYGNMNELDAVLLAKQVQARVTIPCHFGTFSRHKGNPYEFETEMKLKAPGCREYTMTQGEIIFYSRIEGIRK